jgi:hypothetical protein
MELYRVGIKFFLVDPASLRLRDLVPIFHNWIQKQAIPSHLLIDVHDYSHIQGGPGILLVGHEGNFSMDLEGGKPGLFYYRKQPLDVIGLNAVLRSALQGCRLLEEETSLRFSTGEFVLISNDRLNAPNQAETLEKLKPALAPFTLTAIATNPKERFTVRVETGHATGVKDLLDRMEKK